MPTQTPITPDRVGKLAIKVATEAAYVLAGLADVVAGTVQDVVKAGKQQASERQAAAPGAARDAFRAVPDQLKGFVGEVTDAYRALSARGRTVFSDGFADTAHRPQPPASAAGDADFEQPPVS